MGMFDDRDAFKDIAIRAIEIAVQDAVRRIIASNVGSGIDSEIKDAIKAEAKRIVTTDPEVTKSIRDRLIYWIAKQ